MTDSGTEPQKVMVEKQAKDLLSNHGISVPRSILSKDLPASIRLKFPVVLKVSDERILHKTDVGGVILNIGTQEALEREFISMKSRFPDSEYLIEEMLPSGIEYIIGITRDRDFGQVIMLGSGGIFTELYGDVTFRKIPIFKEDAEEMITGIASGRFCQGFRGKKVDCNALADLLIKISALLESGSYPIESMDLNPVIALEKGVVVADAKIILRGKS